MPHSPLILVDSSVWVDFFHKRLTPDVEELKRLARVGDVMTGDVSMHEVLRGFDDDNLRAKVLRVMETLECPSMLGRARAPRSAERYRALRRRGVTIRKLNDAIIASSCIDDHVPLRSSDRDFEGYVPLGLELVRG